MKIEYSEDKKKVRVRGKIISLPNNPDSDNDGIGDKDDPTRMEYTITERTISMIEGLSYSNLSAYVGLTLGEAIENGAVIKNISDEHIKYLKDAIIVHANDSGNGYWKDFWDSGLGFVALKFVRSNKPTSVVFALRGTEPDSDLANDAFADLMLGIGWDSEQSRNAFKAYKEVATNKNYDYYIAGHSLAGSGR